MALCWKSLTVARHVGQVYGLVGGVWEWLALRCWCENHSFKQEPQKVWRQSMRVRGR